jgi:hypothetical protein
MLALTERIPIKPYCTNNFKDGLKIRPREMALKYKYLQLNAPFHFSFMLFDLDFPESAFAFEKHWLPYPTFIVINKQNGHSHYIYALQLPVIFGRGNDKPKHYFMAIEHTYRTLLNADPAYSGLTAKNPWHDGHWLVIKTPLAIYELGQLAECVKIQKSPKKREMTAGQGRNVTLFDELRLWAYKAVRQYHDYDEWHRICLDRCDDMNTFEHPLPNSEVRSIANSVARWVWEKMGPMSEQSLKFRKRQSARSRKGLLARLAKNEDKRASAKLMRDQGMTLRAIAQALEVSKDAVAKWLQ